MLHCQDVYRPGLDDCALLFNFLHGDRVVDANPLQRMGKANVIVQLEVGKSNSQPAASLSLSEATPV